MIRLLAIALAVSALPDQDAPPAPKREVQVKAALVATAADLWEHVREVDPALKALGAEVGRLAKALDAESIEDRARASTALKALGLAAYGPLREARKAAATDQVRAELDAVLKELADGVGSTLAAVPASRKLSKEQGGALRARMKEAQISPVQQPHLVVLEGQPASVFVGEEGPAGPGRRRLKLDGDGRRVRIEQDPPALPAMVGMKLEVLAKVLDAERRTLSLGLDVVHTVLRKPVRERETPLGRVPDPELVEVAVELSPELESGQVYVAGPFPAVEEHGRPWWILVEAELGKP